MKQTPVPPKGPTTPVKSVQQPANTSNDAQRQFLSAALSMSWQLAIVVLLPVIGGFELDKKLNMTPLLTIVGFLMAMVGMAIVVWRQLQLNTPDNTTPPPKDRRS